MRIKKEVLEKAIEGGIFIKTPTIGNLYSLLHWLETNTDYTWISSKRSPTEYLNCYNEHAGDTSIHLSNDDLSYGDFSIVDNHQSKFSFDDIWEDDTKENHEDETTIAELENTITRVKEVISSNNYILENLEKKLSVAKFNKKRKDNIVNSLIDRAIMNMMKDMSEFMKKKEL